jgi:hypothetical protein
MMMSIIMIVIRIDMLSIIMIVIRSDIMLL